MNAFRHLSVTSISILIFALVAVSAIPVADADDASQPKKFQDVMPVKTVRPSYEYQRCFDTCQQTLDKALEACAALIEEADTEKRVICKRSAIERFEQSLALCPVDTGWRDQR